MSEQLHLEMQKSQSLDMGVQTPGMPEMPEFTDPFEAMLWVIFVQMPAALDIKQGELGSLSTTLSRLSDYQHLLSKSQNAMNDLFDTYGWSDAEIKAKSDEVIYTLEDLHGLVSKEDVLTGTLKADVLEYLNRFITEVKSHSRFESGDYFPYMWNYAATHNPNDPSVGDGYREIFRKRLEELNMVEIAFKSTSSETQAHYQYVAEDYKAWVGLTKTIMEEFFDQVGAPIRESLTVAS